MVEITTRSMNQSERDILQQKGRALGMGFAIVLTLLALLGGGFLSMLLRGIGQNLGPVSGQFGYWIGWGIAVILGAFAARAYFTNERKRIEAATLDLQTNQVEEIVIAGADVVEIGVDALEEPAIVFRLDGDQLLLMQGGWLFDPAIYGDDPERDLVDMDPEFFNGLRTPRSFPSSRFVVIRFPLSKQIAAIRVEGEYVAPRIMNVRFAEKYCELLGDCELLAGNFRSLEQSLQTAFESTRDAA